MKAKELKEILKNIPDDNPIGFYIVGVEWTDKYDINLGNPEVICSNGINDEGWVDFGFQIPDSINSRTINKTKMISELNKILDIEKKPY